MKSFTAFDAKIDIQNCQFLINLLLVKNMFSDFSFCNLNLSQSDRQKKSFRKKLIFSKWWNLRKSHFKKQKQKQKGYESLFSIRLIKMSSTLLGSSVTRCWNKSSPNISKNCPKGSHSSLFLQLMFSWKSPKSHQK